MSSDQVSVLIADDNASDRMILRALLAREGYAVYEADDGEKALSIFSEEKPDVVLMDALMPNMDGLEATTRIKALAGDRFVPVIFLTSLQEAGALAECIEAGGDDFLTKPYNQTILRAKLSAFERVRQLNVTVHEQKNKIEEFNKRLLHEQDIAKQVFDNITPSGRHNIEGIKQLISSMAIFNGDVVLADYKPSGGIHVMVGDFTGHGLPAALGAMPLSEIFYGMTRKGFSLQDILAEINKRLKRILPVSNFCCAMFVDIDTVAHQVNVWNGGLPDALIIRKGLGVIAKIKSTHLPLGILSSDRFNASVDTYELRKGDLFCMFSDGVIEMENQQGEFFGADRIESVCNEHKDLPSVFDKVVDELADFSGTDQQTDDITFVELRADTLLEHIELFQDKQQIKRLSGPRDWTLSLDLRPESLKHFDPLPIFLHVLMECPYLQSHRSRLYTILSELYSNALEHGVLGLDSNLKKDPAGFASYYQMRQQRLEDLDTHAYVNISIEHRLTGDNEGDLIFRFEDSGKGFDYASKLVAVDGKSQNLGYCGRGIPLIRSLARTFEYLGAGNIVQVIYHWNLSQTEIE